MSKQYVWFADAEEFRLVELTDPDGNPSPEVLEAIDTAIVIEVAARGTEADETTTGGE